LTRALASASVIALACAAIAVGCASDDRGVEAVARVRQKTTDDGVAETEYGQPDFTTGTVQPPLSGLHSPRGVSVDTYVAWNRLHLADSEYHRTFSLDLATLDGPSDLFGQGSFDRTEPDGGGVVSQYVVDEPFDIASYDSVWLIADTGNNRVLVGYEGSFGATQVLGQTGRFDTSDRNRGGIGPGSLASPKGVAILSSGGGGPPGSTHSRGYVVSDSGNHRVLVFAGSTIDATGVVGQSDFGSALPNHGFAVSAIGLNDPRGVARASLFADQTSTYDPTLQIPPDPRVDGFYVADRGNNRVLHFKWCSTSVSLPQPCSDADVVYGQPGFTTADPGVGADRLNAPTAVAIDPNGGLWVADTGNNRVLHYSFGKTVADRVLGQPSFDVGDPPATISNRSLSAPEGVAVAPNGDVFVADTGSNRIVRYAFVPTSADQCDDGDPCTEDTLGATACLHDFHQALRAPSGRPVDQTKACSPFACDLTQRKCESSCIPDGVCYLTYLCTGGNCISTCGSDGACVSGFCADGFCCDTECSGTCEACNIAGYEGTCTAIGNGKLPERYKPHVKCAAPNGATECAGSCNGFRRDACEPIRKGLACGARYCEDGVASRGGQCDGAGSCVLDAHDCFPFACGAGECRTSCAANDECASGAECASSVCVATPAAYVPIGGSCVASRASLPTVDRWGLLALASIASLAAMARRKRSA
jgi:sugar lactone lactonase YvrE